VGAQEGGERIKLMPGKREREVGKIKEECKQDPDIIKRVIVRKLRKLLNMEKKRASFPSKRREKT